MEPGNYLRIFLGRWKVIALAGLIGLAAGFFTAPAKPRPAPPPPPAPTLYTATNILISDSSPALGVTTPGRAIPDQNLGLTALLATVGEVPKRAAEALGITPPEALAAALSVVPDTEVGTLRIVASDRDGTRAAEIANTVALKLQDYLREQKRDRYQAEFQDADTLVKDLQRQLDAVQASISRLPVIDVRNPPSDPVLNAQRDAINKRLQAAKDRIAAVQAAGEPTSGLLTLQVARPVESGTTSAPVTPSQNAAGGRRPATTLAATATTVQSTPAVRGSGGTAKLARTLRMPIAGGMGLFLGAGLALLRERFDARVRTRRAAERAFGLPVVAEIPGGGPGRRLFGEIAVEAEPLGSQAESYRLLRSRVLQADNGSLWVAAGGPSAAIIDRSRNGQNGSTDLNQLSMSPGQTAADMARWGQTGSEATEHHPPATSEPALGVIMVTSPDAGDGKTSVSVNLAAAISETGTTALVLDLDFRNSNMRRFFDDTPELGLSDMLEEPGAIDIDEVIGSAVNPSLRVALSGHPLTDRVGTLLAERNVVTSSRSCADVVLLDTPPFLLVSDASELIPTCEAVLLVCRVNKTTVEAADRTSEALARLGAPVLGLVLLGGPSARRRIRSAGSAKHGTPGGRRQRRKPALVRLSASEQPEPTVSTPPGGASVSPPLEPVEAGPLTDVTTPPDQPLPSVGRDDLVEADVPVQKSSNHVGELDDGASGGTSSPPRGDTAVPDTVIDTPREDTAPEKRRRASTSGTVRKRVSKRTGVAPRRSSPASMATVDEEVAGVPSTSNGAATVPPDVAEEEDTDPKARAPIDV